MERRRDVRDILVTRLLRRFDASRERFIGDAKQGGLTDRYQNRRGGYRKSTSPTAVGEG
jgi:hypothetical protein